MSSSSSSEIQEEAISLLRDTRWFNECSDEMCNDLSKIMKKLIVEDHYRFIEEDEPIETILIIEKGVLRRTKLSSTSDEQYEELHDSMVDTTHIPKDVLNMSILVDKISGRGRVTGILHNFNEKSTNKAYATVYADGPAIVWTMDGKEFRNIISSKPNYALSMMSALSYELRTGSKSVRAMIKNVIKMGPQEDNTSRDSFVNKMLDKKIRVLCYDTTSWVSDGFKPAIDEFNKINSGPTGLKIIMDYTSERLNEQSAMYAAGYDAICLFVNDTGNAAVLKTLSFLGVKMIAMRCAGFDRIDTKAARAYGLTVARVPAYSPYAVAEMAISLLMSVNRKIARASNRVRDGNFTLDEGLMGVDIHGKTVGVMGTGKIGQILSKILVGFGATLLAYDVFENDVITDELGGTYVSQDEIFDKCDVIFLMMPLLPATKHTINIDMLSKLKKGVILINTARGGLVDTKALLKGLSDGIISGVGMDVYENEDDYFFQDWSARTIKDDDLVALMGNNKVVMTAHQAFFTKEAVTKIISTTIDNLHMFTQDGKKGLNHPNNCIPTKK